MWQLASLMILVKLLLNLYWDVLTQCHVGSNYKESTWYHWGDLINQELPLWRILSDLTLSSIWICSSIKIKWLKLMNMNSMSSIQGPSLVKSPMVARLRLIHQLQSKFKYSESLLSGRQMRKWIKWSQIRMLPLIIWNNII